LSVCPYLDFHRLDTINDNYHFRTVYNSLNNFYLLINENELEFCNIFLHKIKIMNKYYYLLDDALNDSI